MRSSRSLGPCQPAPACRLFAETEIGQQRAGQDATQWQGTLAAYLLQIASDGQHPHLATALARQPSPADLTQQQDLFGRAMTRPGCQEGCGLLPPLLEAALEHAAQSGARIAEAYPWPGGPSYRYMGTRDLYLAAGSQSRWSEACCRTLESV